MHTNNIQWWREGQSSKLVLFSTQIQLSRENNNNNSWSFICAHSLLPKHFHCLIFLSFFVVGDRALGFVPFVCVLSSTIFCLIKSRFTLTLSHRCGHSMLTQAKCTAHHELSANVPQLSFAMIRWASSLVSGNHLATMQRWLEVSTVSRQLMLLKRN